jgi:hypothetical protein
MFTIANLGVTGRLGHSLTSTIGIEWMIFISAPPGRVANCRQSRAMTRGSRRWSSQASAGH